MIAHADMVESFEIFARYGDRAPLAASVGLLYAGPDPAGMRDEDRGRLRSLGWTEAGARWRRPA